MKKGRVSDWLPADQRSAQESILFNNFISDLGMDIRKVIMKFAKNTVLETSSSSGQEYCRKNLMTLRTAVIEMK